MANVLFCDIFCGLLSIETSCKRWEIGKNGFITIYESSFWTRMRKNGEMVCCTKAKAAAAWWTSQQSFNSKDFFLKIFLCQAEKSKTSRRHFCLLIAVPLRFFSAPSYCMVCCCFYFLCFFKSQQAVRRLMNWTRRRTNKDRKRHDMNGNSGKTEGGRIEIFGNYAPRPRSIRGKNLLKIVSKSSSEK